MIRVIIVEDSPEFTDILTTMFNDDGGIDVVGTAQTKEEAIRVCIETEADIVLVDLNLGGHNQEGFEIINQAKRYTLNHNFVILTAIVEPKIIAMSHLVGAMRYLEKNNLDFIIPAIKDTYRLLPHLKEAAHYQSRMSERIMLADLTDGCREIYHYWISGYSLQEIAESLNITEDAARKRIARLKDSLNKHKCK